VLEGLLARQTPEDEQPGSRIDDRIKTTLPVQFAPRFRASSFATKFFEIFKSVSIT
jgi:hypothetical protein